MPREEKNMLPSLTMGGKEMAKQAGKLQPTAVKDHGNYVQWDVLNMTKVCCVPTHIKKQHTFYIHIEKKKKKGAPNGLMSTGEWERRAAKSSQKPLFYTKCSGKEDLTNSKATSPRCNLPASLAKSFLKTFLRILLTRMLCCEPTA